MVLHGDMEVLKWYMRLSFPNHCKSGSRMMMMRYGLSMSPCIVPMVVDLPPGGC